ncbi:LysR family transcriptional regulator [Amycolatopsis sp. BJA-103]|uniref:LysR family transcriptional regulator n=1 Tax=Amycolatopsis sp. BJA-103 TaxID=1911175 RepID=UPI000C7659CB|nr:LysR family transcriptional regulator [Amycolatopsis sp. BJA-103]AUI59715.1 LysR family transcriptional regulator [Amycolatopsis sp. BJA-103]PNE14571.1 LysR family transcriptional regulator [Amycolatopsis sp. BJA-103]
METRQLECFVAVAEELSFTRAARRLFAVQSTVSATIQALEGELGVKLFDRSTRRVELSPAGKVFLPEAKAALEAVDRAREAVADASAGLRGSLRIGTLTSVGGLDLPDLLGAFHRRYPLVDLHVTVSITGSTGLAEDLRQGRLDVALLGLPESDLAGLRTKPLGSAPFVVVLPDGHRLGDRRSLTLADLTGESFVDNPRGFGNRVALDRAFEAIGAPRRVIVEVADLRLVPAYVAAGLGIAVVPDLQLLTGVRTIPLDAPGLVWPLTIATRGARSPGPAARLLLDLIDGGGYSIAVPVRT